MCRKICLLTFAAILSFTLVGKAENFLWKVKGAKNTVYIQGSIHVMKKTDYPLAKEIVAAYTASKEIVFEVDLAEANGPKGMQMMMAKGTLPAGQTLKTILKADVYKTLNNATSTFGLPGALIDGMKPWLVIQMVTILELQKLGFNPQDGLDLHFFERAKKDGKKTGGLEDIGAAINALDKLTQENPDEFVEQSIADLKKIEPLMKEITAFWKAGDAAGLDKALLEEMKKFPEVYKSLLVDRNHNWMDGIEEKLKADHDVMIIVGSAHLVGKDSVLKLLKKKGYTIDQL